MENTDVFGIIQTIKAADLGPLNSVCILGSGATASSSLSALSALGVTQVMCYARNQEALFLLGAQSEALGMNLLTVNSKNKCEFAGELVISTVPSSAQKQVIEQFAQTQSLPALLDIAYNPWPSQLASYWALHHGGPVLSGIEMLLWQACAQIELFTGKIAPIEAMRAALPTELSTA